jgi:hypothetical protein
MIFSLSYSLHICVEYTVCSNTIRGLRIGIMSQVEFHVTSLMFPKLKNQSLQNLLPLEMPVIIYSSWFFRNKVFLFGWFGLVLTSLPCCLLFIPELLDYIYFIYFSTYFTRRLRCFSGKL